MNVPRAKLALLFAAIYSVAIIVAGFLVPMYSSISTSSSGEVLHGSATLVAENGLHVVFILAIPLLLTLAVGVALSQRERRRAMAVAWTLAGLLALFNLAALMTIGVFIIPVTVALLFACSRCSPGPKQRNLATDHTASD
jgi:hypothetical protein